MKTRILTLVIGMASAVISSMLQAAPDLSIGNITYDGVTPTLNVPVGFTNDGTVVSIQFDINYSTAEISAGDAVAGTELPSANGVYSNELGAGAGSSVRRVVSATRDELLGLTWYKLKGKI